MSTALVMAAMFFGGVAGQELHDPHGRWQVYVSISLAVLCLIGSWRLQHNEEKRGRTHGNGDDL